MNFRQVLTDLPVLSFEEKFVEKSQTEPEWGIIQTDDAVYVERCAGIIPGADAKFFQDASGNEFRNENMHHVNDTADKCVESAVDSGKWFNESRAAVNGEHPERRLSH